MPAERWQRDEVVNMTIKSYEPNPGSEDLRIRHMKSRGPRTANSEAARDEEVAANAKSTHVRQMNLRRPVLEKYGFTMGCPGCNGMLEHRDKIPNHSPACRQRIRDAMERDPVDQQKVEVERRRFEHAAMGEPVGEPAQYDSHASSSANGPESSSASQRLVRAMGYDEDVPEGKRRRADNLDQEVGSESPVGNGMAENVSRTAGKRARDENESRIPRVRQRVSSEADVDGDYPMSSPATASNDPGIADESGEQDRVQSEINALINSLGIDQMDIMYLDDLTEKGISELYSMPRTAALAPEYDLRQGWSLDVINGWDLSKADARRKARELLRQTKPKLLIGSPMCRMFSSLMNLNWDKMTPQEASRAWQEALMHLNFAIELYNEQMNSGRLFLHEHPLHATSWQVHGM